MFIAFPKLARLSRDCVITEKLDGTNAAVIVSEIMGDCGPSTSVYAQSRTRMITPGKTTDNYGFAAWVKENEEDPSRRPLTTNTRKQHEQVLLVR